MGVCMLHPWVYGLQPQWSVACRGAFLAAASHAQLLHFGGLCAPGPVLVRNTVAVSGCFRFLRFEYYYCYHLHTSYSRPFYA